MLAALTLLLAITGADAGTGTPVRVAGPDCRDGPLEGPGGFAVWLFCEDALATHIGVVYSRHMASPVDGAWSITDRFWQSPAWGADVQTIAWLPDRNMLFVSTGGVYGTGGLYQLDLPTRKVHELLPADVASSVTILSVAAEWARKRPDIQYVVGWPAANLAAAKAMQLHETWSSGGLSVKTTGSTDEGVGFLVAVDGLTLYHAGDHARWAASDDQAFMAEIRWLKAECQPIDVALLPIATGAACDPRPSIWDGVRSAALELMPRVLIPMHVGCADRLEWRLAADLSVGRTMPRPTVLG